jgi:hypothetical protein
MILLRLIMPAFCALLSIAEIVAPVVLPPVEAQEKVNSDSLLIEDFSKRVADYGKLHKAARSQAHALKPTNSAEAIAHHEHEFARRIRESRPGVQPGNIFTPEIAAGFRRLLGMTMQGPEGPRIRESLRRAAPLPPRGLRVNHAYPDGLPLESTPPSLLLNLPKLPAELEYRIVGHELILRDVEANLIVDLIPNAIP